MEPHDDYVMAALRTRQVQGSTPKAISVRYNTRARRIVIHLSSRLDLVFSPEDAEGLEHATAAQLKTIELSPSGLGIHFPKLDADLYIPALLEGFLGSRKWMAARLGASGGSVKSAAKTAAARRNGRRGGRPKKRAAG